MEKVFLSSSGYASRCINVQEIVMHKTSDRYVLSGLSFKVDVRPNYPRNTIRFASCVYGAAIFEFFMPRTLSSVIKVIST